MFRAFLRIRYRYITFFANRYSINLPAQLVEVDSNQISYQNFVAKFSGKEIMRIISPKDIVLYYEFLYRDSENLIIIGGFKGYNLNRFEYLRNLNTVHVYEPNPEFASQITSNISNLIVHVEAVGQHDGSALLRVSGDNSYLDSVEGASSIK